MKYGCIGGRLTHSFSREIHACLDTREYTLCELAQEELTEFFRKRDFLGINVTIPYKEAVIPYLDGIDPEAREIGAVNTIVNRGGRLTGYNTDVYGMRCLAKSLGIDFTGRKVLVCGTGGTSKTAVYVARSGGAAEVIRLSRTGKEGALSYEEAYRLHTDAQIIINTTPAGMYPDGIGKAAIDISRFPSLTGVIDAVYNPLRSALCLSARRRGIPAEGGLLMLVMQGVRASEIFTGQVYSEEKAGGVYKKLLSEKENTVLIGMPGCGKSTVGRLLAKISGREFIDTDEIICQRLGTDIPTVFCDMGEPYFRDAESEVIKDVTRVGGRIISTGGGAILREGNVDALRQNGRIYFIDRPAEEIIPTDDRPLAKSREDIARLMQQRHGIYISAADFVIHGGTPEEIAEKITEESGLL